MVAVVCRFFLSVFFMLFFMSFAVSVFCLGLYLGTANRFVLVILGLCAYGPFVIKFCLYVCVLFDFLFDSPSIM